LQPDLKFNTYFGEKDSIFKCMFYSWIEGVKGWK